VEQTYEQGIEEGERRERAAVVAWLRAEAMEWEEAGAGRAACRMAALTIERSEHRREEEP
jgi:hypothetical protein